MDEKEKIEKAAQNNEESSKKSIKIEKEINKKGAQNIKKPKVNIFSKIILLSTSSKATASL